MTLGSLDVNGIGRYTETTPIGTQFKDYMNEGLASVSAAMSKIRGVSFRTSTLTITAANTWFDVVSVTTDGGARPLLADWDAVFANPNSGANRVIDFRILCDGVQVGDIITYDVELSPGTNGIAAGYKASSTPAAGSKIWKLQARCIATASAVNVLKAALSVTVI